MKLGRMKTELHDLLEVGFPDAATTLNSKPQHLTGAPQEPHQEQ
jgi:hypothetical protein